VDQPSRRPPDSFQSMSAQAELFAERGVRSLSARAQRYVDRLEQGQGYELPGPDWQRRTIALVDVSPDRFYCLDCTGSSGGEEHWWSFHTQQGEFATEGSNWPNCKARSPVRTCLWRRRLAQVPRLQLRTTAGAARCLLFPHLYNVQRGKSDGVWSAIGS